MYQIDGRRVFCRSRRRHARVRPARDDESRRRVFLRRRCRQRSAGTRGRPARAQDGRRVLSLDAAGARGTAERGLRRRPRQRSGFDPNGNAPEDPQGEFTGKNLLYVASSVEELAERTGRTADEIQSMLARARMTLFQARLSRPRPHLDDKVLTGWNGLMLAAFARAARVLPRTDSRERYLEAAERSARFLEEHMWDAGRQILKRRYRDGDAAIDGYAEDYASLIFGLIELFQAGGDPRWLAWARTLQAAAGRAVLGCVRRRLVQHDRRRPDGHPADEGRLRRRRAVAELDLGAQPADARASDRRAGTVRAHRQDAPDVRPAHGPGGAGGTDDDGCALHVSRQGGAGRDRRTAER